MSDITMIVLKPCNNTVTSCFAEYLSGSSRIENPLPSDVQSFEKKCLWLPRFTRLCLLSALHVPSVVSFDAPSSLLKTVKYLLMHERSRLVFRLLHV